jgi:TPR repeat protein
MTDLSVDEINVVLKEAHSRLERKEYERALALYEQIFDGRDAAIAAFIGYIYWKSDSPKYNATKAKQFYQIAAEQGHTYAQHALGSLRQDDGNIEAAVQWYLKASDGGDSLSSYKLCRYFDGCKEMELADRYLIRALDQGNVLALQWLAARHVKGHFGVIDIFKGIYMCFAKIPNLIEFVKTHENSPAKGFNPIVRGMPAWEQQGASGERL